MHISIVHGRNKGLSQKGGGGNLSKIESYTHIFQHISTGLLYSQYKQNEVLQYSCDMLYGATLYLPLVLEAAKKLFF